MSFITQADYKTLINDGILLQAINNETELLTEVEAMALGEAESYLSTRFDTAAIFALEANERPKTLLMFVMDIALYHLHARVSPRQMNETREKRYERAIDWMRMVASGDLATSLPLKVNEDGENEKPFSFKSAPKFNHHY